MRILVVGSGAREHALAWKLAQEAEVICCPGNPGIAEDVEIVPVPATDFAGVVGLARDRKIDLVVIGPEDPLVDGLADFIRAAGIPTFGPGKAGAQLEGSKEFSKRMMQSAGVPTAEFESFQDVGNALEYVQTMYAQGRSLVVKASGNALGKGVIVAEDQAMAEAAVTRMMVDHEFGHAGSIVVLEERLIGREFSLLTMVGDHNFVSLPVAQDFKRAHDGDQGPNTGGMGSYSPCRWLTDDLVEAVEKSMVEPMIRALREDGVEFRGLLFTGVMVTAKGPYCLEYNVRFGDPETQTVMMRLDKGLAAALNACAVGETISTPSVRPGAAVTVVVASGGYPGNYAKGVPIEIGNLPNGTKLFHAGTDSKNGQTVTAGGRVISASAYAESLEEAQQKAYEAAKEVSFEGAFFRTDIASEELARAQ